MQTREVDCDQHGQIFQTHVIAITSIHRNGKATIIDTLKPSFDSRTPTLRARKVRLSALDRRIWPAGYHLELGGQLIHITRAIILLGEPIHPDPSHFDHRTHRLPQQSQDFLDLSSNHELS